MNDKYLIPVAILIAGLIVAGALIYTKVAPSQQLASMEQTQEGTEQEGDNKDNQPAPQEEDTGTDDATTEERDSLVTNIGGVTTFYDREAKQVCKKDGKPVVYLFSTTWCPHCIWIKPSFDKVAKEYVAQGKIKAYHWELDTNDDSLTDEVEAQVPQEIQAIYKEFNPRGSIPTFVFGCKYYRIGNGHERTDDLGAEEKEFRALIDYLIANS